MSSFAERTQHPIMVLCKWKLKAMKYGWLAGWLLMKL